MVPTDSTESRARISPSLPPASPRPIDRPLWAIPRVHRGRRAKKIEPLGGWAASLRKIPRLYQQRRILWRQSKSLAQCFGRSLPIIIEICSDRRPREQRIRQVWFEGERSFHRLAGSGQMSVEAFLAPFRGIVAIPDVGLG